MLTLRCPSGMREGPRRSLKMRDLGIVVDGALLIRNGLVLEAGPTRRLEKLRIARKAIALEAEGRVVMPGFVDSDTQLAGAGLTAAEIDRMATSRLEGRARSLASAMSRHGVTSIEASSGLGSADAAEMKVLRALRDAEAGPWDVVPTYAAARDPAQDLERLARDRLPRLWKRRLAWHVEVTCDPDGHPVEAAVRYLQAALAIGFGGRVRTRGDGVEAALEAPAMTAIGLQEGRKWADSLALSPVIATLHPDAGASRELIDRGAAVALASGYGRGAAPTWNPQTVAAIAVREHRFSLEEALTGLTINAAYALGLAGRIGSLEPGKQADLILLNCSDYRDLAAPFGVNHVFLTMKLGMVVYREGSSGRWPKS